VQGDGGKEVVGNDESRNLQRKKQPCVVEVSPCKRKDKGQSLFNDTPLHLDVPIILPKDNAQWEQ